MDHLILHQSQISIVQALDCSVDNAYAILNLLGTGALISKIDLKNAFRLIPVHPNDWNLLGICWRHKFYIDTCLPFGLRSAPFLFNQLSIAIHWILQHKYSVRHLLLYLDEFLLPEHQALLNVRKTLMRCYHYVRRSMLLLSSQRQRVHLQTSHFLE